MQSSAPKASIVTAAYNQAWKPGFPKASIVIASYNNKAVLEKALDAMLALDYPSDYEIIVVDDGSGDGTIEMLSKKFGKEKKIKVIAYGANRGVCFARNEGIRAAQFPIVVNMDHDCIPGKSWLRDIVKPFANPKIGVASSFGSFGGTSTAFRRELLVKVHGYDQHYRYYREDTDLTFKIMELGFEYKRVKAPYIHDHKEIAPKGFNGWMKYMLKRLRYHENDVLLYKKHPALAKDFLHVKLGFLIDPREDFKTVVNLWQGSDKKLKLCSPRGLVLIRNKTPLHAIAIIFLGCLYVIAVKSFRLWGSIRFRQFLI